MLMGSEMQIDELMTCTKVGKGKKSVVWYEKVQISTDKVHMLHEYFKYWGLESHV